MKESSQYTIDTTSGAPGGPSTKGLDRTGGSKTQLPESPVTASEPGPKTGHLGSPADVPSPSIVQPKAAQTGRAMDTATIKPGRSG